MIIDKSNIYVLIMAGGVGSRFWPMSRNEFPKQFIDILGTGNSLLQTTYERFSDITVNENIYVLTNKLYGNIVKKQLPELISTNILLEPDKKNTAPCLAYASYKIYQKNPKAIIIVAPSDHLILKENNFKDIIINAVKFAANEESIMTLGIKPTRPDTGYGYIKFNSKTNNDSIFEVESFFEKPNINTAEQYILEGSYLWNAGIFIWSVKAILNSFENYAHNIHEIFLQGMPFYNTNKEQSFIEKVYSTCPNISIDYAILEKANNVYTIPSDIGWSDLGTWASLHQVSIKDDFGNSITTDLSNLESTKNCLIKVKKEKAVVIKGLDNYIIVDQDDVLLIYPKNLEQEIKDVSSLVSKNFGSNFV